MIKGHQAMLLGCRQMPCKKFPVVKQDGGVRSMLAVVRSNEKQR